MKILLTGFEPFGGSHLNPSSMVVEALATDPPGNLELVTEVLAVVGGEAGDRLVRIAEDERPDAIVMLGEATGRAGVTIEQVAINLRDYGMDDNAGHRVSNEPVVRDGPDAYFTTLPVEELIGGIRTVGIPASRSLSAGAFLCNEISYRVLHANAVANRRIPAGFVHLPRVPEQCVDADSPQASMALDRQVAAVRTILEKLAR